MGGGGWFGGNSYHNYQGCWSYETPDKVGVQAKPATAIKREGRDGVVGGGYRKRFEVIASISRSEDIHQVGGWSDTKE